MSYSGVFSPQNPRKYRGDVSNIIWRSTWERAFMEFCDTQPAILEWSSEEEVVQYRCPVRGSVHRYFIDFAITYRKSDGTIHKALIEIKPDAHKMPPAKPKRMSEKYKKAVATYLINQRKWEAATAYAKSKGMEFRVLTEHDLGFARK